MGEFFLGEWGHGITFLMVLLLCLDRFIARLGR